MPIKVFIYICLRIINLVSRLDLWWCVCGAFPSAAVRACLRTQARHTADDSAFLGARVHSPLN